MRDCSSATPCAARWSDSRKSTTASGRSTTARFFWHASMSARNASMAERQRGAKRRTTARELSLLVIEDTARRPHRSPCDLSQRRRSASLGHSGTKTRLRGLHQASSKCYLCSRSILLPMFPVAQSARPYYAALLHSRNGSRLASKDQYQ